MFMADLAGDIRIALESGKVEIGINSVMSSMHHNTAKLVVMARGGKASFIEDIKHLSTVTGIEVTVFEGNSMELGALCGKPYSISSLAILEPGNSHILENYKNYGKEEPPKKKEEKEKAPAEAVGEEAGADESEEGEEGEAAAEEEAEPASDAEEG